MAKAYVLVYNDGVNYTYSPSAEIVAVSDNIKTLKNIDSCQGVKWTKIGQGRYLGKVHDEDGEVEEEQFFLILTVDKL